MYFYPDLKLSSVQFSYLLLESNRVYTKNSNESNFHIFHTMISAKGEVENKLKLNMTKNYVASHKIAFLNMF